MNILKARIVKLLDYANEPHIELLISDKPERSDLVYDSKAIDNGMTAYFAESDGYVSFMLHNPWNENGYGGAVFEIFVRDQGPVSVRGPWSSRPDVMNRLGFTPSVDASYTTDPLAWERGFTFTAGHVTAESIARLGPIPMIGKSWKTGTLVISDMGVK